MKRLNRDAIIEAADARIVARFIGIDVKKLGSNTFGECISGLHSEKRHDNNVFYKNGCHCFSCGQSYNTIDMVMQYCNVSFQEACDIIGETIGGVDGFREHAAKRVILPITDEEIKAIGLEKKRQYLQPDYKEIEEQCSCEKAKQLLAQPAISLRTLYAEDKEAFFDLCIRKAEERIEVCKSLAGKCSDNILFYRTFAEKHNAALIVKQKLVRLQKKVEEKTTVENA